MLDLWSEKLLVANSSPYEKEQLIFESSTAGTYEVELLAKGKYEVYVIAGGAGGAYRINFRDSDKKVYSAAGGGSGSGFMGIVKLPKGVFTVNVGNGGSAAGTSGAGAGNMGGDGGSSYISDFVTAYGGGTGYTACTSGFDGTAIGGSGGAYPNVNVEILSSTLQTQGNAGSNQVTKSSAPTVSGGASVYNGYGQGGNGGLGRTNGTAGYVKIVYKG